MDLLQPLLARVGGRRTVREFLGFEDEFDADLLRAEGLRNTRPWTVSNYAGRGYSPPG